MALVKNIDFHIHGYDDFIERVLPELDVICNETLADPEAFPDCHYGGCQ